MIYDLSFNYTLTHRDDAIHFDRKKKIYGSVKLVVCWLNTFALIYDRWLANLIRLNSFAVSKWFSF